MNKRILFCSLLLVAGCKSGGTTHKVEKGDSTYRIAQKYGVSVDELSRANELEDPKKIYPGQQLVIPDESNPVDPEPNPEVPIVQTCDSASPSNSDDVSKSGYIWPVAGVVISRFGKREGERHDGIDIAAPAGTPVWASAEGQVLYAGEQDGYGRIVIIQHADKRVTIYAHNRANCVADGDHVGRGDPVALVGRSGGASSPFVHFEVRKGEKTMNPRRLLP